MDDEKETEEPRRENRQRYQTRYAQAVFIERTLFIIDWLLDADMQRRAQIGLNKGAAHHALKNALRIGRQGEIRDRIMLEAKRKLTFTDAPLAEIAYALKFSSVSYFTRFFSTPAGVTPREFRQRIHQKIS